MKVVHINKKEMEDEAADEFELLLEEDGMTAEEEAFIRGWEGVY